MSKSKLSFGIIGIAGTVVLLVISLISIIGHESYSLLNGFITELGKYPAVYLGSSAQLTFNIGLVVSGLLLSIFMIGYGIKKDTPLFVATSFFGVLTGVLIAAQGVITLNVASTHYVFTFLLFLSAALTCALFIVSTLLSDGPTRSGLADILVAFAAGVVSIIFAVFVQIGNMPRILSVPIPLRIAVIPFAIVQWAGLLLIFAFVTLLAVRMIMGNAEYVPNAAGVKPPKTKDVKPPKTKDVIPPKTKDVQPPKTKDVKPPKAKGLKIPKFKTKKSDDRNMDF
ncbi:MAG: hypothetical protein HN948_08720 [Clostridia bacterium]|jgi:hypothetical protein|nr:hypothetical protein [Clostridia bacterium]MBT7123072.1 hypothetical protein [Clostridia bacterium]